MPSAQIATIDNVDAARADRLDDHARIDVIGMARRRLDALVRTVRVNLPEIDGGADGAVESDITVAPTIQPLVLFRRQAMASRTKRRLIVSEAFQVHAPGRETGLDRRSRGAPDRQAAIPH